MWSQLLGLFQLSTPLRMKLTKYPPLRVCPIFYCRWGIVQGGHIKGSSGFICFPSGDLELLRDPAAGRGQPWPLDWGGDSRILPLHGSLTLVARMSQMWCPCDTVPRSTTGLSLLMLLDNLWPHDFLKAWEIGFWLFYSVHWRTPSPDAFFCSFSSTETIPYSEPSSHQGSNNVFLLKKSWDSFGKIICITYDLKDVP